MQQQDPHHRRPHPQQQHHHQRRQPPRPPQDHYRHQQPPQQDWPGPQDHFRHQQAASMPVPPRNGIGVAGFVLGVLGLFLAFIPIIGVIAWPLVLIGLPLALIGYLRARRGRAGDRGLSLAGVITSAAGLIICISYVAAIGSVAESARDPLGTPPQAPAAAAETSDDGDDVAGGIGTGVHLIGPDMDAGEYRTAGPASDRFGMCTWSRLAGTSGEFDDWITGDVLEGPGVVTIQDGDYAFETTGCEPWERIQ